MKYFNALTRKKVYIDTQNKFLIEKEIHSGNYLNTPIESRLNSIIDWFEDADLEGKEVAQIEVTVNDHGDYFLDDTSIFDLMSNIAVAYSRKFPKQEENVLQPKKNLLEKMPISPISTMSLTMIHIVDIPIQIIVHRNHEETDSYERVELI